MLSRYRPRSYAAWISLALTLLFATGPAGAAPNAATEQTIRQLIAHVAGSDLTFMRNAGRHTPAEAAAHMEKKYRHFRDDIDTAEDFIRLCATRSLLSGKPYRVVDHSGNSIPTADWLRAELAVLQAGRP